MDPKVVFIHSLFRSGSTYFFNLFRQTKNYWCYQEPLHEAVFEAQSHPESLLKFHDNIVLRHPKLDKPYYQELYEVKDAWQHSLRKESIYDHYFLLNKKDKSIPFFLNLIQAAKGVPVIQECRTSYRISNLKKALGGVHLYLWRNPWDQWWSYQINDYFNAVTFLILNAHDHPPEIARFREAIKFQAFHSHHLVEQVDYFRHNPFNSQINYQAFYLLWCLGLRESLYSADIIINIDKLSKDSDYRTQVIDTFNTYHLQATHFQDCHIPQSVYTKQDQTFFQEQEDKIHHLLYLSWSRKEVDNLITLRQQYLPSWSQWEPQTESEVNLYRDIERLRSLAHRLTNEQVMQLTPDVKSLQKELHKVQMKITHLNQGLTNLNQELEYSENKSTKSLVKILFKRMTTKI